MRKIRLFFFFFVSVLMFSFFSVAAEEYDSYILKLKETDDLIIISAEEKDFLVNNEISMPSYQNSTIEYIEPNYDVFLCDAGEAKWNFNAVNANVPQEYSCYGNDIKIAVIDSGVYQHELLNQHLLEGYNFVDNSTDTSDSIGHGTFVASIICMTANDTYTEGIAPKSKIVPLKCFEGNRASVGIICDAIRYAVDTKKCNVINMSFGLSSNSIALQEAVEYALSKNVILVSAVGNSGSTTLTYPSAYSGVVGVGAVDKDLRVCGFSQHNSSVAVVAPGKNLSGLLVSGNDKNSGTSFSTPHVSAAAAIALCIDNTITPQDFLTLISETSTDLGDTGYDEYYGYGLLNIGELSETLVNHHRYFMSPINIEENQITVTISNNTDEGAEAVLINSEYLDDRVEKLISNNLFLPANSIKTVKGVYSGNDIKCFLWNYLNEMKPLCKCRTYNVK